MIRDAACGALSGLIATAPMTAAMEIGRRRLPPSERYALPPRQIVRSVADKAGVREHLKEPQQTWLAAIGHFGYGAAVGALYGVAARKARAAGPTTGLIYGIVVWVGSYMGLLPSLRILPPATQHPRRRNLLMIAAHLVWGLVTGALVNWLQQRWERSYERHKSQSSRKSRSRRRRRSRI